MNLYETQIQLEELHKTIALGKYNAQQERSVNNKTESETQYGAEVIETLWPIAYDFTVYKMNSSGWHNSLFIRDHIKPEYDAFIQGLGMPKKFNTLFNKRSKVSGEKRAAIQAEYDQWELDKVRMNPKNPIFLNSLTVAYSVADHLSSEMTVQGMSNHLVELSARQFSMSPEYRSENHSAISAHFSSMLVSLSYESNIFTIDNINGRDLFLNITFDWISRVEEINKNATTNTTEYAPMVSKPNNHYDLLSGKGGYYTSPTPVIKYPPYFTGLFIKGILASSTPVQSCIKPFKYKSKRRIHPMVVAFRANSGNEEADSFFKELNKAQRTGLSVNTALLDVINEFGSKGIFFDGYSTVDSAYDDIIKKEAQEIIDKRNLRRKEYAEYSVKAAPTYAAAKAKHEEALARGEKVGKFVMKPVELTEYTPITEGSERLVLRQVKGKYKEQINKAKLLLKQGATYSEYPAIYYPLFCDFRSRAYPYATYGLSPQGCEMSKGLLLLANKKVLNESGFNALYATLGNALGYDKKDINIKTELAKAWFRGWNETHNYSCFFENNTGMKDDKGHVVKFDEPINAMAICIELHNALLDPNYKCGYIAHRDARCSGPSIISTSLRDIKGMKLTSVSELGVDTTNLPDAYRQTSEEALTITVSKGTVESDVLLSHSDELFTRGNFKHPVMVNIG